ncbi:uncharacterized protein RHIMIDRAFT_295325 [Rhizopus microsporus ATCC 52813]|uniref:Uncharacterized protein n=1 Tax=Rhizopus microsporus ATCC 52813 TaxID=1340429 RepID=A0A2G4SH90_RHIZD|nr:uncharacterized protein RHIMIDRAFT_295325 [Rhizopus microsporus ATCC 52813]PHZ08122.1 hypothetical protein RHIMIDRAFT_295325 [Rhizopus microsporus ATCC 52813]
MLLPVTSHLCLQSVKIRVFKLYYLLLFLPLAVLLLPLRAPRNIKTRLIRLKRLNRKKKRIRRQIMSKNKFDVLLVMELITLALPASCVL